jgi:periplasmic protein TonB
VWPFVLCLSYLICHFSSSPAQDKPAPENKTAAQISSVPRVTVKGEVIKNFLIRKVNPSYPSEAKHPPVGGTVKLHVVIGVDGGVKQVEFISGPAVFAKSTMDAVRKWKYKPATANGQPAEVDTTVEVVFSFVQ